MKFKRLNESYDVLSNKDVTRGLQKIADYLDVKSFDVDSDDDAYEERDRIMEGCMDIVYEYIREEHSDFIRTMVMKKFKDEKLADLIHHFLDGILYSLGEEFRKTVKKEASTILWNQAGGADAAFRRLNRK